MTDIRITDPGSSTFKVGQIVSYDSFQERSRLLSKTGRRAPKGEVLYNPELVAVTFGAKTTSKEPEPRTFHQIFINHEEAGEAFLTPGQDFDVRIFLARGAQPEAQQVLKAATSKFETANVSITYYD